MTRALYSRISAHYQLTLLDRDQSQAYLMHGFRQVGLERPCLQEAALDMLIGASDGNPRQLNLLARAAWIAAAQAGATVIGPEHVRAALELVPAARDKITL